MIYPDNFASKIGFTRVLEQVEALCTTQEAIEKLRQSTFSTHVEEVRCRLEEAFEMRTIAMLEPNFPALTFVDTRSMLTHVETEGAYLEAEQLVQLKGALESVCELERFFRGESGKKYPRLVALMNGVQSFPALVSHIDSLVDRYGRIKDSASPELYDIRKRIREQEGQVSRRLQQILGRAQAEGYVDPDASLSIRDGRAVIPVSAANKRKIKGFVQDESATGKTVYIEPIEVVEINNELRELEYAERREVMRILVHFAELLRPDLPALHASGDYLTSIEVLRAKARHALENGCTLPIIEPDGGIELYDARHLLLAQTLKREGKPLIPLNMKLSPQKRILVISGPNAGGKSVCLKTVGLLQYMLQCGFLVPTSERSQMGVFDSIFIDIGDEQSIDNDLSTYSSHLLNMKTILRHGSARSLVLIDEFGTGTEPTMGGAIAESVLERLVAKECYGVITTHYANIKYFASNAEGIANGAMTFDVQQIRPLFQLEMGKPGSSFAIEIARKIGLPEEIIRSASEKVGSDHVNLERQLRQIARDRRYWEQKRDKIHQTEKRVDALADRYKTELEQVKAERDRLLKSARQEAKQITSEANRQIEETIRTIRESQADKEKTRFVRRKMDDFKQQLESPNEADSAAIDRKIAQIKAREERRKERKAERAEQQTEKFTATETKKPLTIEVGVKVRIEGQVAVGEVLEMKGKQATVGFGQIRTRVAVNRLEAISQADFKRATRHSAPVQKSNYTTSERRLHFSPQIDIRGERVSDALEVVREFVDEGVMLGYTELRILHGKGTGALKEEVRSYLRSVTEVRKAVDDHEEQGGAGITVVSLK